MKTVLFLLNKNQQLHLVANTRSYLKFKNVDCEIKYLNLMNTYSKYDCKYSNMLKMFINYRNNKDLIANLDLTQEELDLFKRYKLIAQTTAKFDLYCFSSFVNNILPNIYFALLLRRMYPNSKFLFGGPEIVMSSITRNFLDALGFDWSKGDVDVSVYNALHNDTIKDMNNRISLKGFTEDNMPIYTDHEIKNILNRQVVLDLSRGCVNNCHYCSTPSVYPIFNAVPRTVAINWIERLTDQGANHMHFGDSNLNAVGFDYLLDGMLDIKKRKPLSCNAFIELKGLHAERIEKMSKLFTSIGPGVECMNTKSRELMKRDSMSYNEVLELDTLFVKYNIPVCYQYIIGFPGQTDDMIKEEIDFLHKLFVRNKKSLFSIHPYQLLPGSYVYENYKKFGVDVSSMDSFIQDIIKDNDVSQALQEEIFKIYESAVYANDYPELIDKWVDKCVELFRGRTQLIYKDKYRFEFEKRN